MISGGIFAAISGAGLVACGGAKEKAVGDTLSSESTAAVASAPKNAPVSQWTVTEFGIGALRAGMSFDAAVDSLKGALVVAPGANLNECAYAKWNGAPAGVRVMVTEGKIGRVDIDSTGVTTRDGAGVGSTEAQVLAMYAGRVTTSPHKYTDGHYLTVKATNAADSLFRIVFESEHGKVTRFRAGVVPAVEQVEGCS